MRGGAQSHLLEADDGGHYVVKFLNNPQHRRILVNELIASHFLQYLQIATQEVAIIAVGEEFLAANPDVYIELGSRRDAVRPGWHFGSRFPGDPARVAVYDFFPDAMLREVMNLDHFLGALVVDKWLANADARQSIYFRARVGEWKPAERPRPRRLGFVASMIDHGYTFNGPHWEFPDGPLQGLALRHVVYQKVKSLGDFQPWLDQVVHFPEDVVDRARKQVPPQWIDGDGPALDGVLERLLTRRRTVPDLVDACRRSRASLFPNWK